MKNILKIMFLSLLIISCSNDDSGLDNGGLTPGTAKLLSPLKDSTCNIGVFESNTESTIKFIWSSAINANSYELVLTNLKDNTTQTLSTSKTELDVKLLQDTNYSWQVFSKSNSTSETGQSEVWEMLNAKIGERNYAPFPSDMMNPKINEVISSTSTTLEWKGNDIDNDIDSYDIYLGTTNPPTTKLNSTTKDITTLASGTLNPNTQYYWYVITKDAYGNQTKSSVVPFTSGN